MDLPVTFGGVPLKELVAVQFDDVAIEHVEPPTRHGRLGRGRGHATTSTAEGTYGSANVTANSLRRACCVRGQLHAVDHAADHF